MSSYLNAATVITEAGLEAGVHAALTTTASGLKRGWKGTVTPVSEEAQQALLNLQQGMLRLADGSEGAFLVVDAPGGAAGMSPIKIVSNGDGLSF